VAQWWKGALVSVAIVAAVSLASLPLPAAGQSAIPDPPANARADVVTSASVQLLWDDRSTGEIGFQVAYVMAGASEVVVLSASADAVSITATELTAGGEYTFHVRACSVAGCSSWASAPVITLDGGDVPASPGNLQLGPVTPTTAQVTWRDNATAETYYQVAFAHGAVWTVRIAEPNRTAYEVTDLVPATSYVFRARACNPGGCSTWSNVVGGTTAPETVPPAPSLLRVPWTAPSAVRLAWADNSTNEAKFEIGHKPTGGLTWTVVDAPANATGAASATVRDLAPGTPRTFVVRACNVAGCSAWSNPTFGTPL
jgi:hypothetical protein